MSFKGNCRTHGSQITDEPTPNMNQTLAQRLRCAANRHRIEGDLKLSLQDLMQLHGEASLAVLLMLLAVVSILPVAGAGSVMSLGIWAVAWSWVRQRDTVQLPQGLGKLVLNARWAGRCLRGLAWLYEQSHRWMRPRWTSWSGARTRLWWGLWMGLMGLVIFLPLPMGNVLPSLSLVLLSLGWVYRDGLALLLSTATGLAGVVYGLLMGHWVAQGLNHLWDGNLQAWLKTLF